MSRTGKANAASVALERALVTRYGTLRLVAAHFLLRSDDGLAFTSRDYARLVPGYGLKQELIPSHYPQHIGIVERLIRALKG